jgi:hypothetical protein
LQNKTTLRFHLTPVRITIIKKTTTNFGEDVGKKEPLYIPIIDGNITSLAALEYGGSSKN